MAVTLYSRLYICNQNPHTNQAIGHICTQNITLTKGLSEALFLPGVTKRVPVYIHTRWVNPTLGQSYKNSIAKILPFLLTLNQNKTHL